MNAFDRTQLCDFARGLVGSHAAEQMKADLAHSRSSRRAVRCFERVARLARADCALSIPENAIRVAKAAGSLWRSDSCRLQRRPFAVLFDSLQEAVAVVGVRHLQPSRRQVVFRSDEYIVDVRLEQETNPYSQVVVGQLLRRHSEVRPVAEVPVLVVSEGRVVSRDLTSRFGEFQASGLPTDSLKLCLLVGEETCIDVPLEAHGR